MTFSFQLRCTACAARHGGMEQRYRCECGATLDVDHDLDALKGVVGAANFDERLGSLAALDRSGVWRFRELVLPVAEEHVVTRGEGGTTIYDSPPLARFAGLERLRLKHEGENPTGSFKDRGMTVAVTMARALGNTRVACASTGNTSASMASYASLAGLRSYVFIPAGNVAYGKLSQAMAYGARTIEIAGDFDAAMELVQEVSTREGIYLLNSLNPFRIEGQKAIAFELLQDLGWQPPDWIVMPGGNLGNSAAIGKALGELVALGVIHARPRLAVIQAAGANPLYRAFRQGSDRLEPVEARTLATAIRIGRPISWARSLREIQASAGVVEQVTDQEIMDAKAQVDRSGIGAEPASCAAVAGLRKLVADGVVHPNDDVVVVLTGHLLKDPDTVIRYHRGELDGIESGLANPPVAAEATLASVLAAMGS